MIVGLLVGREVTGARGLLVGRAVVGAVGLFVGRLVAGLLLGLDVTGLFVGLVVVGTLVEPGRFGLLVGLPVEGAPVCCPPPSVSETDVEFFSEGDEVGLRLGLSEGEVVVGVRVGLGEGWALGENVVAVGVNDGLLTEDIEGEKDGTKEGE